MRGSLVKYEVENSNIDYVGVIIEYLDGFHIKKSWSDQWHLVEQPMCKIYWFCAPEEKPKEAQDEISNNWKSDEYWTPVQVKEFGFGGDNGSPTSAFIEEWDMLLREDEWYLMKNFKMIEEKNDDK
jgi:hypothetical protein